MSSSLRAAIKELQTQVDQKVSELANLKRTVNLLCANLGETPVYADIEQPGAGSSRAISAHEFYGKSPIVAARVYLEMVGEPVPVEEILDALARGGFDFEDQGWEEKSRLRALAISLSKNTAIFHKLPNGTYGLLKWYPEKAKKSSKKKAAADAEAGSGEGEVEQEETAEEAVETAEEAVE